MRKNLAILGIIPLAALIFFALSGDSFSALTQTATNLLSQSQQTTIKVGGDASQNVTPDQISLSVSLNTKPSQLNATNAESQKMIKALSDSVRSKLGPDAAKIQIGQMNLNPINYGGAPADSASFSTYASVQIKTDLDHYNTLSSKLADAGFRVEGISIREVPVESEKTANTPKQTVSIVSGSSLPSNAEFYSPQSITVKAGTTIVWTNDDSAAHTITSGSPSNGPDGLFDSGLITPANTFEYAFDAEGDIPYFCLVHPWMTGEILVTKGDGVPKEKTYQVTMNVIIETPADTIKNAIAASQKRMGDLKTVLDDSGVSSDSIKSNQINFNQVYYGAPQAATYSAYTRIIINTDVKNTEALLSAVKLPGVNIENMVFSVSDSVLDKVRKELMQQALDNALERANEIAEPAGMQLKSIKSIEVIPSSNQYQPSMQYRGVSLSYDSSVYQTGMTSINVMVEFELGK